MKFIPKSTVARCLLASAIVSVILLTGPSLIHWIYRLGTPFATKQEQMERYYQLAGAEVVDAPFSEKQRLRMLDERMRVFLWFHARGWAIDEGHEDSGLLLRWHELYLYWRGR